MRDHGGHRSSSGFIGRNTVYLLLLLAGGYFGYAWGHWALKYYRIRHSALELATKGLGPEVNELPLIEKFLEIIYARTGITMDRSSVSFVREPGGVVRVQVRTVIPLQFPFSDRTRYRPAVIEVERSHSGEY